MDLGKQPCSNLIDGQSLSLEFFVGRIVDQDQIIRCV